MNENEKNAATELTDDELDAATGGAYFIQKGGLTHRCELLSDSPEDNENFEAFYKVGSRGDNGCVRYQNVAGIPEYETPRDCRRCCHYRLSMEG